MKDKIKIMIFNPFVKSSHLMNAGKNLIDCAVKHKVKRIVMLSVQVSSLIYERHKCTNKFLIALAATSPKTRRVHSMITTNLKSTWKIDKDMAFGRFSVFLLFNNSFTFGQAWLKMASWGYL